MQFPPCWDDKRVQRLIADYERQTDAEAVAEDEAASEQPDSTLMEIPLELVSEVREQLAKKKASS